MGFPSSGGFDFMSNVFPVIFTVVFVLVFGIIIISVIKGAIEWNKNNNSPILTVDAEVVAKRMSVSSSTHHHSDNIAMNHSSSSTTYYTTFEIKSGDRLEFKVPDKEYGLLVEGDNGRLTYQGTRYKGFLRRNREK